MSLNNERDSYQNGDCNEKLLPSKLSDSQSHETRVYKLRWYILIVYCLNGMLQNMVWNTWSPIQETARAVYHWESGVIDLLPAWGSITYIFTMFPFAWLMDVKG